MTHRGVIAKVIAGLIILGAAFAGLAPFSVTGAGVCPPGWKGPSEAGYCFPPECSKENSPPVNCTGRCQKCAVGVGGAAPNCTCCVTKATCLTPSTFKNYEKQPIKPDAVQKPSQESLPPGGTGKFLKQMQP